MVCTAVGETIITTVDGAWVTATTALAASLQTMVEAEVAAGSNPLGTAQRQLFKAECLNDDSIKRRRQMDVLPAFIFDSNVL